MVGAGSCGLLAARITQHSRGEIAQEREAVCRAYTDQIQSNRGHGCYNERLNAGDNAKGQNLAMYALCL